mgnify:CR=1 FL=1
MGIIFNIQKFCLHDGDGIRTCVFLKGCPLRCIWCHNPEGLQKSPTLSFNKEKCTLCGKCLAVCSSRAIEAHEMKINRETCSGCGKCAEVCLSDVNEVLGKEMTAREVLAEIIKDKMFYESSGGGLTVTGGEPSFQPDFTLELLTLAKKEGISLAIETCGMGSRDFYKKALELGTTFLYDIKSIDPIRHKALTGADNTLILSNLKYLFDNNADVIIRLPLIPDCNDSDEDISALADFLKEYEGRYRYAEIMPYHALGTGKAEKIGTAPQYTNQNATNEQISRWKALFASHGIDIKISH